MKTRLLAAAAITAFATATTSQAAPFQTFDPRSMGMGGIGTSAGNASNAAFYNPALLGNSVRTDLFSVDFYAGARVADPNEFLDAIDNLSETADDTDEDLERFSEAENPFENPDDARAAGESFRSLVTALDDTGGRPLELGVGGGALLAMITHGFGLSIQYGANLLGGFQVDIDDEDTGYFNGFADDLIFTADFSSDLKEAIARVEDDPNTAQDELDTLQAKIDAHDFTAVKITLEIDENTNELDADIDIEERDEMASALSARGAHVEEFSFSLARDFNIGGGLASFGITPRFQTVTTFDYRMSAEEGDDLEMDEGTNEHSAVDFDLGVAHMWDLRGHQVRGGLVVRNLMNHSFKTELGNTIEFAPQMRAGVSHHTRFSTVGMDLDLMENDPIAKGFDQPTQYLGLGAELNAWRTLLLRVGYRTDLAGSYNDTIHMGLSLANAIDVAVVQDGEDGEFQGAVRIGYRW